MPKFIGVSDVPYTHDGGTVCLGDVVDLSEDEAARGMASGQIVPAQVTAPEIAPAPTVPDEQNEVH